MTHCASESYALGCPNISYSHLNFIRFSFLAYYNSVATSWKSYVGALAVSKKTKQQKIKLNKNLYRVLYFTNCYSTFH